MVTSMMHIPNQPLSGGFFEALASQGGFVMRRQ